ncbi:MAG: alpha-glucan family phosphorylase [Candidatus Obscuribacterales bacterium]
MDLEAKTAYFSMEIAFDDDIPTYAGGLGVLAGDTIQSAANLKVPMVAVSLLHRNGYFSQSLDEEGGQRESSQPWPIADVLLERQERVSMSIEGREVHIRAWQYQMSGSSGFIVPIYLLDTDLPVNGEWDRRLCDDLYGGDQRYRFCQEVILGIGGVRMLRALGYQAIQRFHMNEGHSSLLGFELLEDEARHAQREEVTKDDIAVVRQKCVFTTHTPVPAAQHKFPMSLVEQVLGYHKVFALKEVFCCEGELNMTYLALNLSHYVNGVAKRHREVSQLMFARYEVDAITNGVNAPRWASRPLQQLFDRFLPGWREDNFSLRGALRIPTDAIWKAHGIAKQELLQYVQAQTGIEMEQDVFTIGFARRAAAYKRGDLIFRDIARLREIHRASGKIQLIFSGKAHPQDAQGKQLIRNIFEAKKALKDEINIAYIENYNIDIARRIVAGVDLWLNTPQAPLEASGTSGMKAAINGVPSMSILDGWWIEGCLEGVTGWAIGGEQKELQLDRALDSEDSNALLDKLSQQILPLFYNNTDCYVNIMTNCIAINGSYFNTQRMLQQYVLKAYFLD